MKITVGKKLLGLVGALLLVSVLIWASSTIGMNGVVDKMHHAGELQAMSKFMVEKEVDHLKWVNALSEVFTMDREFEKQLDPHKCGFGKWYYEFVNSEEYANLPESEKQTIMAMEEPHRLLHNSAAKIKDIYQSADLTLDALLAKRWIDHLSWMNGLNQLMLFNHEFEGGLDPHKCAFGKWYDNYSTDDNHFRGLLKNWEEPHKHLHAAGARIVAAQKAGKKSEARRIYSDELKPALNKLEEAYHSTITYLEAGVEAKKSAMTVFQDETIGHLQGVQKLFADHSKFINENVNHSKEAADSKVSSSSTTNLIIAIISIIVGLILGIYIIRNLTRPIVRAVGVAKKIAQYDLTSEPINSKATDEVGDMSRALDEMNSKLIEIISTIASNTEMLASAATEISSSAEQLSAGSKEQTNQTAQVSTAVEEMTATIVETSKNTTEASEKAKEAATKSQEGGQLAEDTSRGMEEIVESSNVTSQNIKGLAEKATAIGEIIKVIDDIADQTNLLALNAAIEAARAGEQGRGFAVVADEVRKLAERTTKATKEVAESIKGIQADVSNANEQITESKKIVGDGKELVEKTNSSLIEIFSSIEGVQEMMRQIATASEEQSAAAEEISKNVENVNRISQESSTGTEQAATAAEQLNRQSEELRNLVGGFKLRQETNAGV